MKGTLAMILSAHSFPDNRGSESRLQAKICDVNILYNFHER